MSTKLIISLFFLLSVAAPLANAMCCTNQNGECVDWFALYKLPGNITTGAPHYYYVDSNSKGGQFERFNQYPDHSTEPLAQTIGSINAVDQQPKSLVVYNDEPPTRPYSPDGGHAKGFMAWED
mmetsp:Transcript_41214/g.36552  ORF Transcript_41214/g.36552 Transcript_41214/m.36552 type:complete len:123 (-) Transcript_41214:895-1263(-)